MERNDRDRDREQDNERNVGLLYAAALTGRLSRREVLKRGAALGVSASALAALLAACGGGSAPAPTSTAGGSAAAGGNTASGTPTKAAAAGSAAANGTAKPVLGADLVGKLEGAEVITDPAQIPKSFKEAPQLADLVKAGKLPPVEQRVSQEPMVVKPLNEVGKYGGTWRRAFTGPGDGENGNRINSTDKILFWDYTGNKIIPSLAKGWELSADGTSCKVLLRKGARWSDGEPFTADDFMFWYQDIYQNKDLLPAGTAEFSINGKPGTLNKIDDTTVEYKFPEAYPAIVEVLAGSTNLGGGHASRGDGLMGSYAPAHYLKQFHPKYVGQDKVDQLAKDAKYDNWVLFFKFKNNWRLNTELPVMCPWKTTAPINTTTWVMERNPFYWAVDTAGNQLPYIDKISMSNAESIEVVGLRGIAGQIDYQARNMELTKLPVFLQNQKQGDYTVHLDPGLVGTDGAFYFNQSYDGDAEITKWITNKDFRNAFSLGIDRAQMNEAFWLGLGTPGSPIPEDTSPYNPGPEWRTKWHVKDIKQANDLLDKVGLTKKDSEGYRLRTDNGQRLRLQVMTISGSFLDFGQIGEMVTQQVKQIGLQLDVSVLERTLATTNAQGNKHQMFLWTCDGTEKLPLWPQFTLPLSDPGAYLGPLFSNWYASGGKVGKQPTDPQLLQAINLFFSSFGQAQDQRYKTIQEVWKIAVDQCWTVGTVGLSPAVLGVRIVKNNVGNVPARQANGQAVRTPCSSQPTTFYFKS
jgi:peptide/nickel transport system substrate-binding protein